MIPKRLRLSMFPFSHLQGQADRVNYLMTKQAKIVAMTCTHAALKRREFLQLGLKYDNLLMEESAQILEIETFIPMLLQVKPLYTMVCFPLDRQCSPAVVCCACNGHGLSCAAAWLQGHDLRWVYKALLPVLCHVSCIATGPV